jgi:hypothetical protein
MGWAGGLEKQDLFTITSVLKLRLFSPIKGMGAVVPGFLPGSADE